MPNRELPVLSEEDLYGPYSPNLEWRISSQRDLWIPVSNDPTDERRMQIVWADTDRRPVDTIPADQPEVVAACVDGLFVDHDEPGVYQKITRVTNATIPLAAQYEDDDWLSEAAIRKIDKKMRRRTAEVQAIAARELKRQERIFTKLILGHNGLFLVAQSGDVRPSKEMDKPRKVIFAAQLAGVALFLSERGDEFCFEAIIKSVRTGENGLLPLDMSVSGVYSNRVEDD